MLLLFTKLQYYKQISSTAYMYDTKVFDTMKRKTKKKEIYNWKKK